MPTRKSTNYLTYSKQVFVIVSTYRWCKITIEILSTLISSLARVGFDQSVSYQNTSQQQFDPIIELISGAPIRIFEYTIKQ